MDIEALSHYVRWLPRPLLAFLEKRLKRLPPVQRRVEAEIAGMMDELRVHLKPYAGQFPSFTRLPAAGLPRGEIIAQMEALESREQARWKDGFVSGAVYYHDAEHIAFLNRVYGLYAQNNSLFADLFPSTVKFEAEIVAMAAHMLGGSIEGSVSTDGVCGTVTSGGTESILLAMKAYRDWARERKGIRRPEIVAPASAHAAFDKAARYFDMRLVLVPLGPDFRADVAAMRRAITPNTAVLVGSAPSFPHGAIDSIEELARLAQEQGIGFHTDACLGGFILPWARRLGYPVSPFDFSVAGVTSLSADTHKYGYAPKGSSVLLCRGRDLRHFQYYTTGEWLGGLYASPTLAGSRPGALSAACWAAMVATGEQGYLEATRRILETADRIKAGIAAIPGLRLMGEPTFLIAFTSEQVGHAPDPKGFPKPLGPERGERAGGPEYPSGGPEYPSGGPEYPSGGPEYPSGGPEYASGVDIYQVMGAMSEKGWALNGLFKPPGVHLCVALPHTRPGVAERFVEDLRSAVEAVRANPGLQAGRAPVYGMAASLPLRGLVDDVLKAYLDLLYEVEPDSPQPLVATEAMA
jgi:sphinganine-1-phosphate aldolase